MPCILGIVPFSITADTGQLIPFFLDYMMANDQALWQKTQLKVCNQLLSYTNINNTHKKNVQLELLQCVSLCDKAIFVSPASDLIQLQ